MKTTAEDQLHRAYLKRAVVVALACLACVASFNLWLDPYGYFDKLPDLRPSTIRVRPSGSVANMKMIRAVGVGPTALIVGNSRAEMGFDPRHPYFRKPGAVVYNLAVPGAGVQRVRELFRLVASRSKVDSVLFAVDFQDFVLDARLPGATPDNKYRNFDSMQVTERAKALLTFTATWDSIRTLRAGFSEYPESLRDDGFNPLLDYIPIIRREGIPAIFQQRLNETAGKFVAGQLGLVPAGTKVSEEYLAFRDILGIAAEHGIKVHVVTYPYHSQYYLLYRELGLWPEFRRWKLDVAGMIEEARVAHRGKLVVDFWDFSLLSGPAVEPVTAAEGTGASKWYWEAGHFKSNLGDRMLATMSDRNAAPDPSALGFLVSADSYAARLDDQDERLAALARARPEMIKTVRAAIARAER